MIRQLSSGKKCPWKGSQELPPGTCPILWHTLYPYFLGAVYGAKYTYNDQGDCHVCCPAKYGVDVIVRVRPNDGRFNPEVPLDWRNVIHAEVVRVHGECDYRHRVGDLIVFPTCAREKHLCPAGWHNIFPFLGVEAPRCIDRRWLRCPDWMDSVYYSLED